MPAAAKTGFVRDQSRVNGEPRIIRVHGKFTRAAFLVLTPGGTQKLTITALETRRLIFGALHTRGAVQTIGHVIDKGRAAASKHWSAFPVSAA